MKYIGGSLGLLIIPIIVNGILGCLRRPGKAEKGKVYFPKFFAVFGAAVSFIFLIPMTVTAFEGNMIWILFLCFSLIGAAFIVAFINCKIEYNENDFTVKNFLGVKRKYTYDQVDSIREDMHGDSISVGKHKVKLDEFAVGRYAFISFVKSRYRKLHRGLPIPASEREKWDIFNGNVYDAGGFLFIYILISVFIIAFGIFFVHYIWFNPSSADNTEMKSVIFESGVTDGDEYVMISSQGERYKLEFWDKRTNRDKIESVCDGMTEFAAYVKEIKTKQGTTDYFAIQQIRQGNTVISSFEETNRLYQKESAPFIFIPIGFAVLWGLFIAGSIVVGRNPIKYRRFVKLFFQSGYVKY